MKQLSDFQFPESVTIERQVLSDALYNIDLFPDTITLVSPDMFYNETAKRAWEMMTEMYNKGEVIDIASLSARLGKEFGQFVFSDSVTPGAATSFYQHISILRDTATRRRAYRFAINLLGVSVKPEVTEDTIAMMLEGAGEEVISSAGETSAPLSQVVDEVGLQIEKEAELRRQGKTLRVRTGIDTLDYNLYQGFGPGQLVILAARPSVGKTAVMLQFAMSAARNGFPTEIYTLEMTRQELTTRMLYSTGVIKPEDVVRGQMNWAEFENAVGIISSLPIQIDDRTRNLSDICSKIRRGHNQGRCGIAFIDYLGLIRGVSREQRYREVAEITGDLKSLAKDLSIPIVLLCQLNRQTAGENRPPQLYDLRESGDIEQDADIVLMLERTDNKATPDSPSDINLWVRKNRQYKVDFSITLRPNDTYTKFYELTTEL